MCYEWDQLTGAVAHVVWVKPHIVLQVQQFDDGAARHKTQLGTDTESKHSGQDQEQSWKRTGE